MRNSDDSYDPIGVVVDWLDACKNQSLADLINLYDGSAVIECCDGQRFEDHRGVERYWQANLAQHGAVEIDALMPTADGVSLDYRAANGIALRTLFRFAADGRIANTTCVPVERPMAA